MLAFHVIWRDVTIDVIHAPHASADHAFVLFQLGSVEETGGDPLRIMQTLLEANFLALRVNGPAFSRNPVTGDVVLQCVYSLQSSTPQGLYRLIEEGVTLTNRWRRDHFLAPQGAVPVASRRPPAGVPDPEVA
jgi:hypothetical protein